MDLTVNEVRQTVLKDYGIDVSLNVIYQDEEFGLYEVKRDKDNNYRLYDEKTLETIILIALLRDIGVAREKIQAVLDGDSSIALERLKQLGSSMPELKRRLK